LLDAFFAGAACRQERPSEQSPSSPLPSWLQLSLQQLH
jgi:hypothetical protein